MKNFGKDLDFTQLIPKDKFEELVKKWEVDKNVTKWPTKKILQILIFSLAREKNTLRDIGGSFNIPRSTLDDALCKRSYGFFQELCTVAIRQILLDLPDRKDRQEMREVLAIDSTVCSIHGSVADFILATKMDKKKRELSFTPCGT